MALSPLRSPAYSSGGRRRNQGPSMAGFVFSALAVVVVGWAAWRYGFGLPARVGRAVKLAQTGQAEVAIAQLDALVAANPGSSRALDGLGIALDRANKTKEAQDTYERARDAGASSGLADKHIEEGRAALGRGALEAAEVEFDHARSLDKSSARAVAGLAQAAHAAGKLPQALELYKEALTLNSSLHEAQVGQRMAREAVDRGNLFYMYDRNGNPLARRGISAEGLGERSYPLSQMTAHVVGCISEKAGDQGLERDLKGLFPAAEVTLTLDATLQAAASKALGWRKGALVAIDPNTGEILAAISQPTYKPATVDKDWRSIRENANKPLYDRALDGLFEPGSIAKIMTAAAAYEAHVDMGRIFPFSPPTAIDLDGKVFRDWADHGKLRSLKEAMDVSSNIAMYKVGKAMGADALYAATNRFGFNQSWDLGFTLPDGRRFDVQAAASRAPQHADTQFALAERACGLGEDYRISPLHAALLAATIANHGKRMKPRLIKEVRTLTGDVLYSMKPELDAEVIKADTAEKVTHLMEDAVEGDRGIGKRARVEGIRIAGKTGTARTHKNGQLDAWFICFAPVEKPRIAVAIFCDQEGTGMHIAAPIAGAFLSEALR